MSELISNFWNCGWVISYVVCGGFAFVDLGGGGVELVGAVVGTGSGVVCSNMLRTSPMIVILSYVR